MTDEVKKTNPPEGTDAPAEPTDTGSRPTMDCLLYTSDAADE